MRLDVCDWCCYAPAIVLGVVRYHQHHFPLEDVVVHQPAADAGNVLVFLHLLELFAEDEGGGGDGGCGAG